MRAWSARRKARRYERAYADWLNSVLQRHSLEMDWEGAKQRARLGPPIEYIDVSGGLRFMPLAPRSGPSRHKDRASELEGGKRADQSGVDVTDEVRAAQAQAEAFAGSIVVTVPQPVVLPQFLREFGFCGRRRTRTSQRTAETVGNASYHNGHAVHLGRNPLLVMRIALDLLADAFEEHHQLRVE